MPLGDIMFYGIDRLLYILESTGKTYDLEKIKSAYEYAKELHAGQYRKSGEEYINHPIAVAEIVAGLGLDTDSLCAALLHDTVEDCSERTDLDKIRKMFGTTVAELVDGLTKLVKIPFEDKEDEHMENLRKMFFAMAKDIRVIFIKLADRTHNMRTLAAQPEESRRRIALETMHVYAPLAHRLGMQKIKQELENLALSYLDPIGYNEVQEDINKKYGMNCAFIDQTKKQIIEMLSKNGLHPTIEGRVKSVYSIYRKMYQQNKSFDEIYDFYAVRIIVDSVAECYSALGYIHEMYNSVPGRFKDYISTPKTNMYSSLHTTVIGHDGIPFEVQIRTWEMHHIAEYGIAAHWKYKTGDKTGDDIDKKLEWIAKLVEDESTTADHDDFLAAIKMDIFQDETFVFTPKGDVFSIPQNSTCIDFAYQIHSEIGNHMVGAKVNGMIVPIDRELQNGEIVEILTSSSAKGPSRDWLNIVKTSSAKAKIRQWFKKEKREENIEEGREEILSEIRHYNRSYSDEQFAEIIANLAARLGMNNADDLCNMIGYGGLSLSKIANRIREEFDRIVSPQEEEPITDISQVQTVSKPSLRKNTDGVIVDGVNGCQVKFAKCCNPLPGDSIIGFITKGYGISVHKGDCEHALAMMKENPDRFVRVEWAKGNDANPSDGQYEGVMRVFAEDRISMLADISCALAEMHVSILQINSQKKGADQSIICLGIACKNLNHFESIVARIRGIKGVFSVERGYSR